MGVLYSLPHRDFPTPLSWERPEVSPRGTSVLQRTSCEAFELRDSSFALCALLSRALLGARARERRSVSVTWGCNMERANGSRGWRLGGSHKQMSGQVAAARQAYLSYLLNVRFPRPLGSDYASYERERESSVRFVDRNFAIRIFREIRLTSSSLSLSTSRLPSIYAPHSQSHRGEDR